MHKFPADLVGGETGYGLFGPEVWLLAISPEFKQHLAAYEKPVDCHVVYAFEDEECAEDGAISMFNIEPTLRDKLKPIKYTFEEARQIVKAKPDQIKALMLIDSETGIVKDIHWVK